jgi:hypothetical protein
MLNLMDAEILFFDPADVDPAIAKLIALGFSVHIRKDWIDEGGPTVFIQAAIMTEVDSSDFFDWVQKIVEPLGGDVAEAGHAHAGIDRADYVTLDQMIANNNMKLRAI